jgi:hypothetical protein
MKETVMDNTQRFWVIGGEFRSLQFDQLLDGSGQLLGPFDDRHNAEQAWRDLSERNRHLCAVRFTIVQEGLRP